MSAKKVAQTPSPRRTAVGPVATGRGQTDLRPRGEHGLMGSTFDEEPLPAGWDRAPIRGDEIAFENGEVAVVASRTWAGDDGDVIHEWELKCRRGSGEHSVVERFGRAPSREVAVEALRSAMKAMNMVVDMDDAVADLDELEFGGRP